LLGASWARAPRARPEWKSSNCPSGSGVQLMPNTFLALGKSPNARAGLGQSVARVACPGAARQR